MRHCVRFASSVGVSLMFVGVLSCDKHLLPARPDATRDAPLPDACTNNLECFEAECGLKGLPPTTLTGTVYAPNGTLPLFGVQVYVPESDPGWPIPPGLQCDRCGDTLPGNPIAIATTQDDGSFILKGVPATTNVPLVIQVGKWRRQLVIPNVAACQVSALGSADTSLPKSYHDATPLTALNTDGTPKVDMPMIAISTGEADALECLPLKLGVDPTEITTSLGSGHVHLYADLGTGNGNPGEGAAKFQASWPGSISGSGDVFTDAQAMWGSAASLSAYDIVMLSCEGDQYPSSKPQTALQALRDYANLGGRVFMSHWHNIWIGGQIGNGSQVGIPEWEAATTWNFGAAQNDADQLAEIDETVPNGSDFAQWMVDNGGSTVRDQVPVDQPRYTLMAADSTVTERLVWVNPATEYPACGSGQTSNCSNPFGETSIQDLEFLTPIGSDATQVCGKVVFSDMHVSSGSLSSPAVPYPDLPPAAGLPQSGCASTPLSPQEKALAFIFFNIASCVGNFQ